MIFLSPKINLILIKLIFEGSNYERSQDIAFLVSNHFLTKLI